MIHFVHPVNYIFCQLRILSTTYFVNYIFCQLRILSTLFCQLLFCQTLMIVMSYHTWRGLRHAREHAHLPSVPWEFFSLAMTKILTGEKVKFQVVTFQALPHSWHKPFEKNKYVRIWTARICANTRQPHFPSTSSWANHASVPGPIGDLLKASKSRDMCELKFLSKNPKNAKKNYSAAIRDLLKSIKISPVIICPNRKLNWLHRKLRREICVNRHFCQRIQTMQKNKK